MHFRHPGWTIFDKPAHRLRVEMEQLDDIGVFGHLNDPDAFWCCLQLNCNFVSMVKQRAEKGISSAQQHPFVKSCLHRHHMTVKHPRYFSVVGFVAVLQTLRAISPPPHDGL